MRSLSCSTTREGEHEHYRIKFEGSGGIKRRFKRKDWDSFLKATQQVINIEDALATDWMLEPIKKEISREELRSAWDASSCKKFLCSSENSSAFDSLCKELGL